jgi:hypothetical protein
MQSGRGFGYPVKNCKHPEQHLKTLYDFNIRKGYIMYGVALDSQFVTAATTEFLKNPENNLQYVIRNRSMADGQPVDEYTSSSNTLIIRNIAIPYEHFTTGSVERVNRTMHETHMKTAKCNDNITDQMWALGANEALDKYNTHQQLIIRIPHHMLCMISLPSMLRRHQSFHMVPW